jgi:hydrogenase expression/formation protein HypC
MCLAVPMKIIKIEAEKGIVELDTVRREINLTLIENPQIGEYVIVHAGFAIEKLDVEEAEIRLKLFSELADLEENQ